MLGLEILLDLIMIVFILDVVYGTNPPRQEKINQPVSKRQDLPVEQSVCRNEHKDLTIEESVCQSVKDSITPPSQIDEAVENEPTPSIDIEALNLRSARQVAKALNIRQKFKGKDVPLATLKQRIQAKLHKNPELLSAVFL
jgi:hypothetical protein